MKAPAFWFLLSRVKTVLDFLRKFRNAVFRRANGWFEWVEMIRYRRMENSRNDWKGKARVRANELREQRKARALDRERIQALKVEIEGLREKLKKKSH